MIVAFNATAYDTLPSGSKTRTVGLAAALLSRGVAVRIFAPRGVSLRTSIADEFGAHRGDANLEEVETPLDPGSPLRRAAASRAWFERNVPRDTTVFVTDYYPVLRRTPTLLTVHDLRYFAAPKDEPARRVAWFRAFYPRMARRAAGVVVPTRVVATEVRQYLGREDALVVGNGVSRVWRSAASSASRPRTHLLVVGFAERRKAFATALAAVRRATAAPPLLVVGRRRAPRQAGDLVADGRVRFAGPIDDGDLVRETARAVALLHTSRYEGFGLTAIEAMAVGTPVIAAHQSAVREVCGQFAIFLPPDDVNAWAAAISSIPEPSAGAREHALSFTWDAAADALLGAISRL